LSSSPSYTASIIYDYRSGKSGKMFTEETVKTVSGFFSIIEKVEAGFCKRLTVEKTSGAGKLYLVFKDARNTNLLCFGAWYELWMRFQAPLWFGVDVRWSQEVVDRFTRRNQGDCIAYDSFKLCSIAETVAAKKNCCEEIVLLLEQQLKTFKE